MAVSYNPKVVTDGLVLCLDAGNTKSYPGSGTTWTDLSGNGNNGTLVSMDGNNYSSANGGYLDFDGSSDYVNLGDKFSIVSGTIDFWIKLNVTIDSSSTGINYRPFGKSDAFECRFNNTTDFPNVGPVGNMGFDFGIITGPLKSNQTTWLGGTWYNIVFNWNSSTNISNLYVQSILDNTSTAPSITGQTGNFSIGASRGGSLGFINGSISSFKIYNRALAAAEVKQNFNALRGRFGI
jgi:hypothetical protein